MKDAWPSNLNLLVPGTYAYAFHRPLRSALILCWCCPDTARARSLSTFPQISSPPRSPISWLLVRARRPTLSVVNLKISSDRGILDDIVLMFGDPYDGDAVGSIPAAKVHTICHPLDGICLGLGIPTPAHLDYQDDADTAAIWVADYLGYST